MAATQRAPQFLELDLNQIVIEKNIRSMLGNLNELIASIEAEGVLEPVLVTATKDPAIFQLRAGSRRYNAAKLAKLKKIPALVIDADDARAHRIALIENIQREEMNPYDRAVAIQEMLELENVDQKTAAAKLGVSQGYVSQHLSILKLPAKVQHAVRQGKIDIAQARELIRLKDDAAITALAKKAPDMTAAEVKAKVDKALIKEEARQLAEDAASEIGDTKRPRRERTSLIDLYSNATLVPRKKTELRDLLLEWGHKYENAKSDKKKDEYRHVLRGIELAAGVEPA